MFLTRRSVLALAFGVTGTAASGALGWMAGRRQAEPRPPELDALAARFGPGRHSQLHEEWIVRDFFDDRRGGTFVDVGANHHERFSNTYYLETRLGWSGLAIEPQRAYADGYRRHRPRTRFLPYFVADRSGATARLHVGREPLVASQDRTFTAQWGGELTAVDVPTVTLDDLLTREGVTRIDFLSMDIELAEPAALAGFDLARFRPALVCIEAHAQTRQAILDYFQARDYVLIGRYLRLDTTNLYFRPASPSS